jgi:dihydroxyacid dehydratase/phosphogluconate dehydratase
VRDGDIIRVDATAGALEPMVQDNAAIPERYDRAVS